MPTIQSLADEMSRSFEKRKRTDGGEFVCLKDDHPEWMTTVCQTAHGDMFPDDQRYRIIEKCVDALAGVNDPENVSIEPDAYTSDLTSWLNTRADRVDYLTQAMEEFGQFDDGFKLLATAQSIEIAEVLGLVLQALQDHLDSLDESADDDDSE